jgi:hypothetical protein
MPILAFKPNAGLDVNKFDAGFFKDARNDGGVEKGQPPSTTFILRDCRRAQPNTPGELRRRPCQQLARGLYLGAGEGHFPFLNLTAYPADRQY